MRNDEDITTTAYRKESNSDGYLHPNWIINQVFEEIKVKQRDPVQNSNVSNENEATQNSN